MRGQPIADVLSRAISPRLNARQFSPQFLWEMAGNVPPKGKSAHGGICNHLHEAPVPRGTPQPFAERGQVGLALAMPPLGTACWAPGEKDEVQDAPRVGFQPPRWGVMQLRRFALGCKPRAGYLESCGHLGQQSLCLTTTETGRGEESQKGPGDLSQLVAPHPS